MRIVDEGGARPRRARAAAAALTAWVFLLSGLARAAEIRLGTVAPEGSRFMRDLRGWGQDVERLSGGDLKIKWYAGGRLGDDRAMVQEVLRDDGRLDGGGLTVFGLAHAVPEMGIWSYPAMFADYDEVDYMESRYRTEFAQHFDRRGLVMLCWADVGFTHVFANEPVATLDDLLAQTVWLWQDDPSGIEVAKAMGLKITSTSLADLVDGLGRTIQTWVFPPLAAIGWGIHGRARYMSEFAFNFVTGAIVIRKELFEALPPSHQKVLVSVSRRWEARLMKSWRAESARAEQAIRKQGTKFVAVPAAERERFFQLAAAQRDAWARRHGLEDLMRRFARDLHEFRGLRR